MLHKKYDAVIFDLFGTLVEADIAPEYYSSQIKLAELVGADFEAFQSVWRNIRSQRDEAVEIRLSVYANNIQL